MNVLVINAGSSSLKYQLFDMENETVVAKGICERIGIDGRLKHEPMNGKPTVKEEIDLPTHAEAIQTVIEKLASKEYGVIESLDEISAVGHRVLHGGQKFSKSVLIDEDVIQAITDCIPLGPLHNPANLMGIKACQKIMPNVPQVAVFDTAFHQTMPEYAYIYPIPYRYYEQYSCAAIPRHATAISPARPGVSRHPRRRLEAHTCHLGNGSSIAAIMTASASTPRWVSLLWHPQRQH